ISRDIEATGFNGTAAFMEVRVQSIVVEFILTHVEQLFGDAPLCGGEAARRSRLFPGDGSGPYNVPAALSQGDGPPPIRPYHTIIELSDHRRKGSLKAKKWKSIFHLGRSDAKRKLGKAEEKEEKCGKLSLRPAKSMDSLSSVPYSSEGEGFDTCSSLPHTGTFPVLEESPEEKLTATEEPRGPESESESSTKSEPTTPRPGRTAVVGARSRAEKCAGVHISGPFSVTVPLHITSNLSRLTRGQQCPALAQHGATGSPLPTRRLTKEPKPPQNNTGEMRGHRPQSVGRARGVITSPHCAFIEEDARLSLELRDSFAFLDCQDAWLEHGDGDTAARTVLGHGGLGDSDGYPAIEEGMESGFMNVSWSSPVEQPDSYLSIEECMDEEMFYMAPSCSDTEEPTGDTDSDDMFLSAHDELSPLAADPETPTNMSLEESGAELRDGSPPPEPCPAEEVALGDGGHLEDPRGDTAEEGGQISVKERDGGDREGNNGWSRTELGLEDGAAEAVLAPGGEEEMDGASKQSEEGDPQPLEGSPVPEVPLQEPTETPLPQESVPKVPPTPVAAAEVSPTPMADQEIPPTPMAVQGVPPTPMAVPEVSPTPMAVQGVPPTPMAVPEVSPTPMEVQGVPTTPMAVPEVPLTPAATTEGTDPPPEAITPTPQGAASDPSPTPSPSQRPCQQPPGAVLRRDGSAPVRLASRAVRVQQARSVPVVPPKPQFAIIPPTLQPHPPPAEGRRANWCYGGSVSFDTAMTDAAAERPSVHRIQTYGGGELPAAPPSAPPQPLPFQKAPMRPRLLRPHSCMAAPQGRGLGQDSGTSPKQRAEGTAGEH
uniref:Rho GTPase activating protein 30 n=1 Tax=Phasianus colchicus TaxID=9054 RepID=A0A669R1E7_PHACC